MKILLALVAGLALASSAFANEGGCSGGGCGGKEKGKKTTTEGGAAIQTIELSLR